MTNMMMVMVQMVMVLVMTLMVMVLTVMVLMVLGDGTGVVGRDGAVGGDTDNTALVWC